MRLIALSFLVLVPLNIVLAIQYPSVNEALMDSVEEAYSHELIDDDIKVSRLPMFKEALELKLRDLNPKKIYGDPLLIGLIYSDLTRGPSPQKIAKFGTAKTKKI